jgi:hypothetical protein
MYGSQVRWLYKINPKNSTVSANDKGLLPIKKAGVRKHTMECANMVAAGLCNQN